MNKKTGKISLYERSRKLAHQWHPTKNGTLTPKDVTPGSNKKVWWVCQKDHEWQAVIEHRNRGVGCPYCSGRRATKENCLPAVYPSLAKQWHPAKNLPLTSKEVKPGSGRKVWWICRKGHEWEATVLSRKQGNGCPYCAGTRATEETCLLSVNPSLARQWHPTKNVPLMPKKVLPYSNKKVWWLCKNGHEWQACIYDRSAGDGCPYCSGRRASMENCLETVKPNLAREWHPKKNVLLTPKTVKCTSTREVWWKCRKGHEWQEVLSYRMRGRACPICVLKAKKV